MLESEAYKHFFLEGGGWDDSYYLSFIDAEHGLCRLDRLKQFPEIFGDFSPLNPPLVGITY